MRRLALAATVLAVGFAIARAPVIRPTLGGALLASAREVAVYRLGPGPVRFALPPGKRSLRVLVNLDLTPPVPAQGVPYAVRVEIPEDGFTASFPLVATPATDASGGPAAFYLGEASAPARTRDVSVERSGDGPATATVWLEGPPGATASLRLLTAGERPPLARDVLLGRLGPEGRARLATSVGPLEWDQLDDGLREGLLERRWTRAAAVAGTPSRRLYVVSVPAPARREPPPRGERIGGDRVAVFTVRGPGTLHLVALDGPLRGEARRLDMDGTSAVFPLALGVGDRASVPIPAGLATVRVTAASAARVLAVGEVGMAIDPGRARPLPGGEAELEPSWRVELSPLGAPGPAAPLVFDLAGRGAEALRVSVRALVEPGAGDAPLRVRWRVLDRRGAAVAAGELPFEVRPAPEDRIDGDEARVPAQPVYFHLWPPPSAERLEVRVDRPAAVGLSSPGFPPGPMAGRTPGLADGLVLRFHPEERPSWFRVRPKDEPALWAAGRMVRLRSALRLEEAPEPPGPPGEAESLEPLGGVPRLLLVVPTAVAAGPGVPAAEAPGRGRWWPILPGAETVVVLAPPAGSAPGARVQPSLLYAGEPALAGREALVTVDGREVARAPLVSPRGQLTLPFLAAGRRRLRVDPGAPARLFVDQPAPGTAPYRAYGTFELEAGAPLRVRLQKGVAPRSLGVTLYFDGRPSPGARLVARIDGGVRVVRAGSTSLGWTRLERQAPVRAAAAEGAFYLNRTGGPVWAAEPIFIPLRDDLRPGRHEIELSVQNAGQRVFARFFAHGAAGPAEHVSSVHEIHTESPP